MPAKPLDLTVQDLIVVGTYGRFTIAYQPALDRWHGILPGQGQAATVPEKALAHYFADRDRSSLLEKLDKHRADSFERFTVVECPEFVPKQSALLEKPNSATLWEVTSQANEVEFIFRSIDTAERRKAYLTNFYAYTEPNLTAMKGLTDISREATALYNRFHRIKVQLKKAELPIVAIDKLLAGE